MAQNRCGGSCEPPPVDITQQFQKLAYVHAWQEPLRPVIQQEISMAKTFMRVGFYELVWSKQITQLARDFRLSDVAIHKIRRKQALPTPHPGWWAKKDARHFVERTYLPVQRKALVRPLPSPPPSAALSQMFGLKRGSRRGLLLHRQRCQARLLIIRLQKR